MRATQIDRDGSRPERDARRTDRWLARYGTDLGEVSAEARELLTARLALGRRAAVVAFPLLLGGVVIALSGMLLGWNTGDPHWHRPGALRYLVGAGLMLVGVLAGQEIERRDTVRLAARLPQRVSRGVHVPVRVIFGRVGAGYAVASLLAPWVLAVALIATDRNGSHWAYLAGLIPACGLVALGLRRVSSRPTIAVDPVSLTIDERCRSLEASRATGLLLFLTFAGSGLALDPSNPWWIQALGPVSVLILLVLGNWAMFRRPWSPPSAVRLAGSAGGSVRG